MTQHVHRLVFEIEVGAPDGERLHATVQRFRMAIAMEAGHQFDIRCTDTDCLSGFTNAPIRGGFEPPECSRERPETIPQAPASIALNRHDALAENKLSGVNDA